MNPNLSKLTVRAACALAGLVEQAPSALLGAFVAISSEKGIGQCIDAVVM